MSGISPSAATAQLLVRAYNIGRRDRSNPQDEVLMEIRLMSALQRARAAKTNAAMKCSILELIKLTEELALQGASRKEASNYTTRRALLAYTGKERR